MVTELQRGATNGQARAARRRTRSWQMRRRTRLHDAAAVASVQMDDPAAPVSEQAFAPMQLRPLTFASREFWILHTTFAANAICSFAVASFLAWNMELLPDAHGARRALMATRCIRCRDERDRARLTTAVARRGVAHVESPLVLLVAARPGNLAVRFRRRRSFWLVGTPSYTAAISNFCKRLFRTAIGDPRGADMKRLSEWSKSEDVMDGGSRRRMSTPQRTDETTSFGIRAAERGGRGQAREELSS